MEPHNQDGRGGNRKPSTSHQLRKPFRGFRSPNYTQVPDELFDELLPDLKGAELKVLLYIIRRTFGFKREDDNISIKQMLEGITTADGRRLDRGVGLTKPTLLKALRELIKHSIVISSRRSCPEKGDQATNYRLHITGEAIQARISKPGPNGRGGVVKKVNQGEAKEFTQAVVKKFAHTINSGQDKDVNVTPGPEEDLRRKSLVLRQLDLCGDPHSRGFYCLVANTLPEPLINRAISETRGLEVTGQIQKSVGACYVHTVTRIAHEHGYDLGHSSGDTPLHEAYC